MGGVASYPSIGSFLPGNYVPAGGGGEAPEGPAYLDYPFTLGGDLVTANNPADTSLSGSNYWIAGRVDDTTIVQFYENGASLYARLGTYDAGDNSYTWGSAIDLTASIAGATGPMFLEMASTGGRGILMVRTASTTNTFYLIECSGGTVTVLDSEALFCASTDGTGQDTARRPLTRLDDTNYLFARGVSAYDGHAYARVLTVTGSTLAAGSETQVDDASFASALRNVQVRALDATHAVVLYREVNTYPNGGTRIRLMTISGTTITPQGSSLSFPAEDNGQAYELAALDASTVVVAFDRYTTDYTLTCSVYSVSGTTLSLASGPTALITAPGGSGERYYIHGFSRVGGALVGVYGLYNTEAPVAFGVDVPAGTALLADTTVLAIPAARSGALWMTNAIGRSFAVDDNTLFIGEDLDNSYIYSIQGLS